MNITAEFALKELEKWLDLIKPEGDVDVFELYKRLTLDELRELQEANTVPEIIKEACDVIVTARGVINSPNCTKEQDFIHGKISSAAAQIIMAENIHWPLALHLVNQSNFSKLILAHEIEAASDYFAHAGIDVTIESLDDQYFGAYSSHDQTVDGKHYPAHKLLKSQNYAPIDESKEWWI